MKASCWKDQRREEPKVLERKVGAARAEVARLGASVAAQQREVARSLAAEARLADEIASAEEALRAAEADAAAPA